MANKKEALKKTKKIISGEKKEIFSLKSETKKSIVGVIFLAFSLFFFLSGFNLTGLVGQKINQFGRFLFGWGFWFFPLTLFFLSLVFFLSERIHHLYLTTILGGSLFFFSFLSLISLFSPGKGGFFGDLGAKLEGLFAFAGSLVFYLSFLVIGLLMALDIPLKLAKFFKKKKEEETISLDLEKEKEKKELSQEIIKDRKEEKEEREEIEKEILPEKEMSLAEEKKVGLNFSFSKKKKSKTEKIFPPLDIFTSKEEKPQSTDIKVSANIIRRTLASFGISVDLAEVDVGPTVTRYSFRPAEGTRLTRITALTNEIALSLAAHPIRIEAPIPGKSLIGIEVPNKVVSVVRLAPLLAKEEFKLSPPLVFPLGRDVTGLPFYADLNKMPHLLIAGSTGSGKSVCIHCLLSSLLFKNTPEELSLILIDPKKVE
ncbi:DNA translocase FtsK, partial [bacterium]|nr:DNA translocase FtsK [bacterium]